MYMYEYTCCLLQDWLPARHPYAINAHSADHMHSAAIPISSDGVIISMTLRLTRYASRIFDAADGPICSPGGSGIDIYE
jgi:hypothetical protein